jgi:carbamoyl-phosphate synthase large subunit
LGGDFITSRLTPLSTGINMESELIKIALGETPELPEKEKNAAAIFYFDFFEKKQITKDLSFLENIKNKKDVVKFSFNLKQEMEIPKIKNSLDRYGFIIVAANNRESLIESAEKYIDEIENGI